MIKLLLGIALLLLLVRNRSAVWPAMQRAYAWAATWVGLIARAWAERRERRANDRGEQ
jgi:hypothetical protein